MFIRSRPIARLTSLIFLALPGACAVVPDQVPAVSPKPVSTHETHQSFAAPEARWPSDAWWKTWDDSEPRCAGRGGSGEQPHPCGSRGAPGAGRGRSRTRGGAALPLADGERPIGRAAAQPELSVSAGHDPKYWRSYPQTTANLSWDLDLWGKNRAALAAATSEAEAARADVAQARLVLSSSVASAWAELARLYATRDTNAQAVGVREKTVDLMRQRQTAGVETEIAVRRAESRLASARGDLKATDEMIALHKNAIA